MTEPTKVETNQELPSLTGYFTDPNNRKLLLILGGILLVLVLCAGIGLINRVGQEKNTPIPTPIVYHSPTPVVEDDEPDLSKSEAELAECFQNCGVEDFLDTLELELSKIKHLKETLIHFDQKTNSCYGLYFEASSPNEEYQSSFRPADCGNGFQSSYNEQPVQYRLGESIFIYTPQDRKWETGSISPLVRLRIFSTFDLIKKQQEITSETKNVNGEEIRILTGTSKTVNEFNKVVRTEVEVMINTDYEIIHYQSEEANSYREEGSYFDFNVPNELTKPAV